VFDPWEALRVAVRVANLQRIGPTKGAIVQLQGRLANLDDSPAQGVIPAYAERLPGSDGTTNFYYIYDERPDDSAKMAGVYWLPYKTHLNPTVEINTLNNSGAALFLSSGLTGCHFLGNAGLLMHSAAQESPIDAQHQLVKHSKLLSETNSGNQLPGKEFALMSAESRAIDGIEEKVRGKSFYGVQHPRGYNEAVVLGWKSLQNNQWFFAFQEQTWETGNFGLWTALGG